MYNSRSNGNYGDSQSSRRGSQQSSPMRGGGGGADWNSGSSQQGRRSSQQYDSDRGDNVSSYNYNPNNRSMGNSQSGGNNNGWRESEDYYNNNNNNNNNSRGDFNGSQSPNQANGRGRSNVSTLPPMSPPNPNSRSSRGGAPQSPMQPSGRGAYRSNSANSRQSQQRTPDEQPLNRSRASSNGSPTRSEMQSPRPGQYSYRNHEHQEEPQFIGGSSGSVPPSPRQGQRQQQSPELFASSTSGRRNSGAVSVSNRGGNLNNSNGSQYNNDDGQGRNSGQNRGGTAATLGASQASRSSGNGRVGFSDANKPADDYNMYGSRGSPNLGGSQYGGHPNGGSSSQFGSGPYGGSQGHYGSGPYGQRPYRVRPGDEDRGLNGRDRALDQRMANTSNGIAQSALEARTMENLERYDSGAPSSKIVMNANEERPRGQSCCFGLGTQMFASKHLYLSDKGIDDLADEVLTEARKESREVEQLLYLPSAAELEEDKRNREDWDESDDDAKACRNLFTDSMPWCPWIFSGFTLAQFLLLLGTCGNIVLDSFGLIFSGRQMVSYMVILRTTCLSIALFLTVCLLYLVVRMRGGRSFGGRGDALSTNRKGINRNNMTYARLAAATAVSPAMEAFMVLVLASFFDCAMLQLSKNSADVAIIGVIAVGIRCFCFLMHFADFLARPLDTLWRSPQLLYAMVRTWSPGAEQIERIRSAILHDYKERYAYRPLALNDARDALIRRINRKVEDYKNETKAIAKGKNEPQAYDTNGKPISRKRYRDLYGRYPRTMRDDDNDTDNSRTNIYRPTPYASAAYPDPWKAAGSVAGYPYPQNTTVNGTALASKSRVRVDPTLVDRFRRACHAQYRHYLFVWLGICLVMLLLLMGGISYELWRIYGNQPPFFWTDFNKNFLDRDSIRSKFPVREATGLKVQLVFVDGLGEHYATGGRSAFATYFDGATIAPDTIRFSARGQMPSFGLPNGFATISGAPPELSGVVGDYRNGESDYDNIFAIAYEYGVHAGFTGGKEWVNMVQSYLPTLGGDAAVKWNRRPPFVDRLPWTSADLSDKMRGEASVLAAERSKIVYPPVAMPPRYPSSNMYELFVTHLEDVQLQGYRYGVSPDFNKKHTYTRAIENATAIIENIVNAMDTSTVLIVTSSNGQVARGGSGGETKELRDIPIVMYQKGSGAAAKLPTAVSNFNPFAPPKSRYLGRYTNMDIAATVTALLGLPSPRQSIGIFIEEALEIFLPTNAGSYQLRIRYYHDLLNAKINVVREFYALLRETIFKELIPKDILQNPMIVRFMGVYANVVPTGTAGSMNVPYTEADYAAMIENVLVDYWTLRNARYRTIMVRNMLVSLLYSLMFAFGIIFIAYRNPFIRLNCLFRRKHPAFAANWAAFMTAMFSVMAYIGLSVTTLFVIYYGIMKQPRWDLTNISYPYWLGIFAVATLVMPIAYFTIITKFCLFRFIKWKSIDAMGAVGDRTCGRVFWFFAYLPLDLYSFFFVTWRYKAHNYHQVLLYTHYLSFITVLLTALMMFMSFPYSFVIPCVLDNDHVQVTLSSYRFRMISIHIMLLPLLAGSALQILFRPSCPSSGSTVRPVATNRNKAGVYPMANGQHVMAPGAISAGITVGEANQLLWDQVWVNCHLKTDDYCLSKLQKDPNYVFALYANSSRASARMKRKGGMTAIVHPSDPLHDLLVNHTTIKVLLAMLTRERGRDQTAVTAAEMALYVTGNVDQIPNLRMSLGLDVDATNVTAYPTYPYPHQPGMMGGPPQSFHNQYPQHFSPGGGFGVAPSAVPFVVPTQHVANNQHIHGFGASRSQHQQQQQRAMAGSGHGFAYGNNNNGGDESDDGGDYQYKYPLMKSESVGAGANRGLDNTASSFPYGSLGDPYAAQRNGKAAVAVAAPPRGGRRDEQHTPRHDEYDQNSNDDNDEVYFEDEEEAAAYAQRKADKKARKAEKKAAKKERKRAALEAAEDDFGYGYDDDYYNEDAGPEEMRLMDDMDRHFDDNDDGSASQRKKDKKSKKEKKEKKARSPQSPALSAASQYDDNDDYYPQHHHDDDQQNYDDEGQMSSSSLGRDDDGASQRKKDKKSKKEKKEKKRREEEEAAAAYDDDDGDHRQLSNSYAFQAESPSNGYDDEDHRRFEEIKAGRKGAAGSGRSPPISNRNHYDDDDRTFEAHVTNGTGDDDISVSAQETSDYEFHDETHRYGSRGQSGRTSPAARRR